MLKPLTLWITTNYEKFLEIGIPDHLAWVLRILYASQEATARIGHETMDWVQNWDRSVVEAVYCHPVYFFLYWCKHNCGFCIVDICNLTLEYILNNCGYVIHHFNVHFLLSVFFANDITCCLAYIYFRLWKLCQTKSKSKWFSYSHSKWVVKHWKELTNREHLWSRNC